MAGCSGAEVRLSCGAVLVLGVRFGQIQVGLSMRMRHES